MSKSKSVELRAGLVVLAGIVILVAGLFLVSGGRDSLASKKLYTIYFKNSGGAVGGDNVYVAGQRAGKVKSVATTSLTRDGERRLYVAVTVEIDADLQLPVDSEVWVSKTITNIVTMHIDYGKAKKMSDEKTELMGKKMATFEEVVNKTYELVDEAQEGIRTFNRVMTKIEDGVTELDIKGLRAEVGEIVASVGRSTARLEKILGDAEPQVASILKNVDDSSLNVRDLTAQVKNDWPTLERKIEEILDEAKAVQMEAKGLISENRPTIKAAIEKLDDAFRRLPPLLAELEGAGKETKEILIENRPKLKKGLADAAKAMENFKELTEDLKTAPWKLINKPSGKESDDVHLYNAARLYVDSAETVGDVIGDLETLQRLGILDDPEKSEAVAKVFEALQAAMEQFDANQRKLNEMMIERQAEK